MLILPDKENLESHNFVAVLKFNSFMQKEATSKKLAEYIENKIVFKNVTTFHVISKLFNLSSASQITHDYVIRWFST